LIRERTRAGLAKRRDFTRPAGRTQAGHNRRKASPLPYLNRARVHSPRSRSAHQSRKDRALCRPWRQSGRRCRGKIIRSRIVHTSRTICVLSCLHPDMVAHRFKHVISDPEKRPVKNGAIPLSSLVFGNQTLGNFALDKDRPSRGGIDLHNLYFIIRDCISFIRNQRKAH
jgi:hypothetical protein